MDEDSTYKATPVKVTREGNEYVVEIDGESLTKEQIQNILSTNMTSIKFRHRIGRDILMDAYFRLLEQVSAHADTSSQQKKG